MNSIINKSGPIKIVINTRSTLEQYPYGINYHQRGNLLQIWTHSKGCSKTASRLPTIKLSNVMHDGLYVDSHPRRFVQYQTRPHGILPNITLPNPHFTRALLLYVGAKRTALQTFRLYRKCTFIQIKWHGND